MGVPDVIAERQRKQRAFALAGYCACSRRCLREERRRGRRRPKCDRGKNHRRG
jgi:hypothetical protein